MIFGNFPLGGGGLGNFWSAGGPTIFGNSLLGAGWEIFYLQGGWPFRGAPKSREAKDFDKCCKNVIEKSLKVSILWMHSSIRTHCHQTQTE